MMRKLAVTVFALSLAALGCGSDSGTKTPDSAAVGLDGGKTDTTVAPIDTSAADVAMGEVQSQMDTAKPDSTVSETGAFDQAQGLDSPPVIDGAKGTEVQGEVQGIDGSKPVIDGGVDAPQSDAATAVDAGSVDAGTLG